mgnify:CR=1 FL=1
MIKEKKEILVSVPHRISGFFQIVNKKKGVKIKNPQKIGSRGAGFNLSATGLTKIILNEKKKNLEGKKDFEIHINGKELNENAETSFYILNYIKELNKKISSYQIKVEHNFDLPVGCGYGASGSGALGLIYGLNEILKLNLPGGDLGKIAHIAEVVNQTGLGTVCGQLAGGLSILIEPGYPCNSINIPYPDKLRVICGSFGEIQTKSILSDPVLQKQIKKAGRQALKSLRKNPSIENFMRNSIDFVKKTQILDLLDLRKVKSLMTELNTLNIIGASMNQLGRSVYVICKGKNQKEIVEILETYQPEISIFNLKINNSGPKIL